MTSRSEARPVGAKVDPLPAGTKPDGRPLFGRYVILEHVDASKHGRELYHSFAQSDPDGDLWTYMGYGPFADLEQFLAWLKGREASTEPLFYGFLRKSDGKAAGMAAFMRHDPP